MGAGVNFWAVLAEGGMGRWVGGGLEPISGLCWLREVWVDGGGGWSQFLVFFTHSCSQVCISPHTR
jgi:hypothetical protein